VPNYTANRSVVDHSTPYQKSPRRARRPWSDRARLDVTWFKRCRAHGRTAATSCTCDPSNFIGNANYRTGAHSKRRLRMESQLARAWRDRDLLVAALRRRAEEDLLGLTAVADQLAIVTLDSLGVRILTHPARGGGKRRLPYYIPDVALALVAAFLGIADTARRFLERLAQHAYRAAMWARATFLRALYRDRRTAYRSAAPHPSSGSQESRTLLPTGSSDGPDRNYFAEKYARHAAGGSGEVA